MRKINLILNDIEQNYNVGDTFKFKKFSAWIKIKSSIFESLISSNIKIGVRKSNVFNLKGLYIFLLSFINLIRCLISRRSSVIYLGAATGIQFDGSKWCDQHFPYKHQNMLSTVMFVNAGDSNALYKMRSYLWANMVVVDNILFWPVRRVLCVILRLSRFDTNVDYSSVVNGLKKRGAVVEVDLLKSSYINYCAGVILYDSLFRLLKPINSYVVSAYSKSDICASLKARNVLVNEIQHGLIGSEHRGYNYSKVPHLPTPDYIFVYNDFWKEELVYAGYYKLEQIIVDGRLKYDKIDDSSNTEQKYILFTGQGFGYSEIIQFVTHSHLFLRENQLKFIYKQHPREVCSELHMLKCSEYIEVYSGIETTEMLIKNSVAHISFYSSCHFDAVHFLGKSFILKSQNDFMDYYLEKFPNRFYEITLIEEVYES